MFGYRCNEQSDAEDLPEPGDLLWYGGWTNQGRHFKNFSEEAVINIISSTLHDNAGSVNNNCTLNFNPMDKLLEVIEENKKLYERLLQSEREKVELLKGK